MNRHRCHCPLTALFAFSYGTRTFLGQVLAGNSNALRTRLDTRFVL